MNAEIERLLELGRMDLEAGYPEYARTYFEKVLALDPNNREATEALAKIDIMLSRSKPSVAPKAQARPVVPAGALVAPRPKPVAAPQVHPPSTGLRGLTLQAYRPLIGAGVTLLMLWLIGIVLKRLPMLRELRLPDVPFSGATIAGIAISLLMVGILVRFAGEFGRQLGVALPQFPESGIIAASLVYIIAIVVAYDALFPLSELPLKEDMWVYKLGFLALALVPICMAGLTVYRNANKVTNLFTTRMSKVAAGVVICPRCKAPNERGTRFCVRCGAKLVVPEKPKVIACPECRAENKPEAKFCSKCGAELIPPEKPKIITCPRCGVENGPDARFCIGCGAKLFPVGD